MGVDGVKTNCKNLWKIDTWMGSTTYDPPPTNHFTSFVAKVKLYAQKSNLDEICLSGKCLRVV